MFRSSYLFFKLRAASPVFRPNPASFRRRNPDFVESSNRLRAGVVYSSIGGSGGGGGALGLGLGQGEKVNDGNDDVTFAEAKKQMKLISEGKETMCYSLSDSLSKQRATSAVFRRNPASFRRRNPEFVESSNRLRACVVYSSIGGSGGGGGALGLGLGQGEKVNDGDDGVTSAEAKKQMKLALEMKLIAEGNETMCYSLSNALSKQRATSAVFRRNPVSFRWRNTGFVECNNRLRTCVFSSSIGGSGGGGGVLGLGLGQGEKVNDGKEDVTFAEAKKQMKLISEGKETMCYSLSNPLSKQRATTAVFRRNPVSFRWRNNGFVECNNRLRACVFSSSIGGGGGGGLGQGEKVNGGKEDVTFAEAKKLMKLVDVEALKRKLITEGNETMCYSDLVDVCESMGVTKSVEESKEFVKVLDEAGVVLIFRDKVYLHPDKVVDLVRRAVPLALTPEDDPRREELRVLQAKQQEIDALAHKQVRCILWTGLGFSLAQIGLFFRLTFWELSWDVMEPIAFFTTTSGLIIGYAYFLFTSSDPTYQDLMKRLFLSRRRKLIKKHNFNAERFKELQRKCKSPLDSYPAAKHHIPGVKLETQDL